MRRKNIYALAAAASSIVGLGSLAKAQVNTVTFSITASDGVWTAYALDSTDNAGIADLEIDVTGSGGATLTSAYDSAPEGINNKGKADGFNYPAGASPITNGFEVQAGQTTTYGTGDPPVNNATSDSLVFQGIGQTSGSVPSGTLYTPIPGATSWTQTALGIEIASGTYTGSGTLTVAAFVAGVTPQVSTLDNIANGGTGAWEGPSNIAYANVVNGSVVVSGAVGHPIISLTAASAGSPSNYGTQITNGTGTQQGTFSTGTNVLTVTGGNGSYQYAQVTGISSGAGTETGYVEANGFNNPATDQEIYALDVDLTSGTLAELAADINASNTADDATLASTTMANDPFPAAYNLFLTFPEGDVPSADNFLGIDLTQDPNVTGNVVAIAVVPEPMSLGLLALGGIGMLARRRRYSKA